MIEFLENSGLIGIHTLHSSYVFTCDRFLKSLHWGGTVDTSDCSYLAQKMYNGPLSPDLTLDQTEYPIADGQSFSHPCLQARSHDARVCNFEFERCVIDPEIDHVQHMALSFVSSSGLKLFLHYTVYSQYDMIERKASVINDGSSPVYLRRFFSGSVHPPKGGPYCLRYLSGTWMAENQINQTPVTTGTFILESQFGISGHRFNPSFALSQNAEEAHGEVWFGLLACSGSWKIEIEKTIFNRIHITAGLNDFDGEISLSPGEQLTSPPLLIGYTANGFGDMSRKLHQIQNLYYSVNQDLRPVLYNSWEATGFDVTPDNQIALARLAAEIGVELFVLDDGWFGKRNDDSSSLGDWWSDPEKFPEGLQPLIQAVENSGMKFGLWVEPEAVSPDSELYTSHPDWIYRQEGLEPRQIRNQYLLNLSLPDVKKHLKTTLDRLLSQYSISFLKWDMNRYITDLNCPIDQARLHQAALYEIWDFLHKKHPQVALENCASGGGRTDLGALQRTNQCWISDNTDPFERLFIQEGFTQFYSPGQMVCWVTDMAHRLGRDSRNSIPFRFHAAMCGCLGIGTDLSKLSETELSQYRQYISLYKEIREIVQHGVLYRLLSPRTSALSALEYVSRDGKEAVIFAFLHSQKLDGIIRNCETRSPDERLIRLRGLDPAVHYRMESGQVMAGSTLLNIGMPVTLRNDYDSCCIRLTKVSH